jgi:AFG3 family protein
MPLKTRSELLNKAVCYLAGRMAEQHFKGYTTNNGDKDLKKAKRIVTFMVSKFGMSNLIGRIGFPDIEYVRKPYSEDT